MRRIRELERRPRISKRSCRALPTWFPDTGRRAFIGQQQIAAQGATIDIGDSVMSTNLQALGTIRANQIARQTDITNLENATLSQDASQQTIMATLQRINQALLLELRNQQDANQINANLALQQMVAQKQQQDALKAGFMDAGNFNNTYQTQVAPAYNGAAQALDLLTSTTESEADHGHTQLDSSGMRFIDRNSVTID